MDYDGFTRLFLFLFYTRLLLLKMVSSGLIYITDVSPHFPFFARVVTVEVILDTLEP